MFYGPFRNFPSGCFSIKASKPKLFDFENLDPGKITKKPGPRFSKSNNFGLEALIKKQLGWKFLNGP